MTPLQHILIFSWLDAAIKATLLLILTTLVAGAARRASASTRHLIWTVGLMASLAIPMLSMSLPHWNASIAASSPLNRLATPSETQNAAATIAGPAFSPLTAPGAIGAQTPPAASNTAPPSLAASEAPAMAAPAAAPADTKLWPWIASAIWAGGAILMLSRLTLSLWAVRRMKGASTVVTSDALAGAAQRAAQTIPTVFDVEIRQATDAGQVCVPITWGARRPVILLPTAATQWPQERVLAALLHERAHIHRWDWSTLMLAQIICAVYWFHPLAWLCARKMREGSETACDDLVVLSGMPAADYARQLLEVARMARTNERMGMGAVAMAQTTGVEGRLRTVLASGLARRPMTLRWAIAAAAVSLLIAVPLAAMRLKTKTLVETRHFSSSGVIELLGVSIDRPRATSLFERTGGNLWWSHDGTSITRPPVVGEAHIKEWPGYQDRQFVFHPVGASPDDKFLLTAPGANESALWKSGKEQDQIYYGIIASFPNDVRTTDIRVRVASGPWRTVTSVPAVDGGVRSVTVGGVKARVEFMSNYTENAQAMSCYEIDDVKNEDTRVIAIDDHGKTVSGKLFDTDLNHPLDLGDGRNHPRYDFTLQNGVILKQLQFQTRPYRWLQFSGIALKPADAKAAAPLAPPNTREAKALTQMAHARLLAKNGTYSSGITELRRAVQIDPNNAEAYSLLAAFLYYSNSKQIGNSMMQRKGTPAQRKDGIHQMQIAVRLKPEDAQYRNILATYLADNHQYREAAVQLKYERHLLKTQPVVQGWAGETYTAEERARVLSYNQSQLGDSLLAARDYKAAAAAYEQALKLPEPGFNVMFNYGAALNGIGRRGDARAAWRKLIHIAGIAGLGQTDYPMEAKEMLKRYP
ncbi:MAG: hypothetical protein JWQ02_4157 [Capsulimonas sp.]|nr:hypothetical protein [Capsulimonas sp.]